MLSNWLNEQMQSFSLLDLTDWGYLPLLVLLSAATIPAIPLLKKYNSLHLNSLIKWNPSFNN